VQVDKTLRRLCGWERAAQVPSEAKFSRVFAEFASYGLPARVHEALIKKTHTDRVVGHIARDATSIEAREKPDKREKPQAQTPRRKRGRPRKGEVVPAKEPRRLERQMGQTLDQMLADLATSCDVGTKRNAKGHTTSWIGYKLHIDTADGDIPVACLLTSASVHDSQVAIPLALMTASRLTNLYDLMDSAYDAPEIEETSRALGHVPKQTILQQGYIAVRQRAFVRRQMCAVTPDLSGAAWREVLVIGETQRRCHERSVHHQISRWVAGSVPH